MANFRQQTNSLGANTPCPSCAPDIIASFNSNGGTPTYASQSGPSPLSVTSPGTPTRSGYNFSEWSPSLPATITVNTLFTAQWINTGVSYNSVVKVTDCTDQQGVATTIVPESNIIVGTQLVSTSGGNLTNLPTGIYRMANNLTDGQTYDLTVTPTSLYVIQVNNTGSITSVTECQF